MNESSNLPRYKKPPLTEVALSVQFEPLEKLMVPQLGLLWEKFRDNFPNVQQVMPVEPVIEKIGVRRNLSDIPGLRLLSAPEMPRLWFLDQEERELIQIQNGRFVRNWRKISDGDMYPHYDEVLRPKFIEDLKVFTDFLEHESIGELLPNQCEVTYVNHIRNDEVWSDHSNLHLVFNGWSSAYKDNLPLEIEEIRIHTKQLINDDKGEFLGRLHTSIEPVFNKDDSKPSFLMKLTARGRPIEKNLEGILAFLDIGREYIVKSFDAITQQDMHVVWEKNNDH